MNHVFCMGSLSQELQFNLKFSSPQTTPNVKTMTAHQTFDRGDLQGRHKMLRVACQRELKCSYLKKLPPLNFLGLQSSMPIEGLVEVRNLH
jgi:hypothetical protein